MISISTVNLPPADSIGRWFPFPGGTKTREVSPNQGLGLRARPVKSHQPQDNCCDDQRERGCVQEGAVARACPARHEDRHRAAVAKHGSSIGTPPAVAHRPSGCASSMHGKSCYVKLAQDDVRRLICTMTG